MSDTPRTDAVAISTLGITWQWSLSAMTEHAEKLERELNTARTALDSAVGLCTVPERNQDDEWQRDLAAVMKALADANNIAGIVYGETPK